MVLIGLLLFLSQCHGKWDRHVTGEPGPTRSLLPDFTEVCVRAHVHVCKHVCACRGQGQAIHWGLCLVFSPISDPRD